MAQRQGKKDFESSKRLPILFISVYCGNFFPNPHYTGFFGACKGKRVFRRADDGQGCSFQAIPHNSRWWSTPENFLRYEPKSAANPWWIGEHFWKIARKILAGYAA
ncbi:hypothetical protein [Allofournierella massiliensis]|uniref:hypothetical protein n=1 Tax=Allofournierella massiliensis TaxID=1650663 RepID=UPI0035622538